MSLAESYSLRPPVSAESLHNDDHARTAGVGVYVQLVGVPSLLCPGYSHGFLGGPNSEHCVLRQCHISPTSLLYAPSSLRPVPVQSPGPGSRPPTGRARPRAPPDPGGRAAGRAGMIPRPRPCPGPRSYREARPPVEIERVATARAVRGSRVRVSSRSNSKPIRTCRRRGSVLRSVYACRCTCARGAPRQDASPLFRSRRTGFGPGPHARAQRVRSSGFQRSTEAPRSTLRSTRGHPPAAAQPAAAGRARGGPEKPLLVASLP